MKPLPPIVEKLIPTRQVHLLAGAPGAGKTTLTAAIAKEIRDGGTLFAYKCRRPNFIGFLAADRAWESHKQWFDAVGYADIPSYSLVDTTDSMEALDGKAIKKHVELLEYLLRKIDGGGGEDSLFIVDPLALFVGGDIIDYIGVYRHLLEVNRLCIARGWTILGTMHGGKQKKLDGYIRPQDRIAGSGALLGCSGTVMYLASVEESDQKNQAFNTFTIMAHHAPTMTIKLKRGEDGTFDLSQAELAKIQVGLTQITAECLLVLDLFSTSEAKPMSEVLKTAQTRLQISTATAYRYKDQLKEARLLAPDPIGRKGWYLRAGQEKAG